MKKLILSGLLIACAVCIPPKVRAVPLDVPISLGNFTSTGTYTISIPTATVFNSGGSAQAPYAICLSHVVVTANSSAEFSIWYTTQTLLAGTTNYYVQIASGTPYDTQWAYRTPFCEPPGAAVHLQDSNTNSSTMTVEGYYWGGWNQ